MTSFVSLPAHISYLILDNLQPKEIIMSLCNVCSRLDSIINSYHRYQVKKKIFITVYHCCLFVLILKILNIERCVVIVEQGITVEKAPQVLPSALLFMERSHQRAASIDRLGNRLIFFITFLHSYQLHAFYYGRLKAVYLGLNDALDKCSQRSDAIFPLQIKYGIINKSIERRLLLSPNSSS